MLVVQAKRNTEQVAKFADMLSAMGTEPRLRIVQLLLSLHPDDLVVGDIQSKVEIPNFTLSRYMANTEAPQDICNSPLPRKLSNRKISSGFVNRRGAT